MFGSEILEVAIGMGALYLVLSLVCSAITEAVARAFAMRSSTLRSGIRNLLSDPEGKGLARVFYDHPLVKACTGGAGSTARWGGMASRRTSPSTSSG